MKTRKREIAVIPHHMLRGAGPHKQKCKYDGPALRAIRLNKGVGRPARAT